MFGAISTPLRGRGAAAALTVMRLAKLGSVTLVWTCVWLVACGGDRSGAPNGPPPREDRTGVPAWFIDATATTGLDFVHFNGMTGEFYYPEVIAPGVALFDYDSDGDLDVFLVQGQKFASGKPMFPLQSTKPLTGRLFRNDLDAGPDGAHV